MDDMVELEAWLFIKQETTQHLIVESQVQELSPLSQSIVNAVIQQFSALAPTANQCFRMVVVRCALNVHLSQQ